MSSRRFWLLWAAGLLGWLAALAAASAVDLRLAAALFAPGGCLVWCITWLSTVPSYLLLAASLASLLFRRARGWVPRPLAVSVVLLWLIYPATLTWLLKLLWGRVRYRDLGSGSYTPFYRPAGPGVGQSFPSGHLADTLLWAPLPFHLAGRGRRGLAALAAALIALYAVVVAAGRMMAGAHFLTDLLFSMGAMWLLAALLCRRRFSR